MARPVTGTGTAGTPSGETMTRRRSRRSFSQAGTLPTRLSKKAMSRISGSSEGEARVP